MNAALWVSKTTLRLDGSLKGFITGLRKFIILTAMIRCGLKLAKEKGAWDDVQEKSGASFHISSPSIVTQMHLILPATMCDST